MSDARVAAVLLAAGKGTRLKTELPKVLHSVLGRPMLAHVVDACRTAGLGRQVIVIGYGKDKVRAAFANNDDDITWVEQNEQLGTGHAAMVCRDAVRDQCDHVVVLCGDGPLIRAETIQHVVATHRKNGNAITLATAELEEPERYGRIHRDANGNLLGIVEYLDCTDAQREIREINPSYYCFSTETFLDTLGRINNDNAKREYYITDCIALAIADGKRVEALTAVPPEDVFSINSRTDLALVNRVLRDRVNAELMDNGVTLLDPDSIWIDPGVEIGRDTVVEPFVRVERGARIGANCTVGPFAHIAAGTIIGDDQVVRGAGAGA